jgi:hypothetical protein
MLSTRKHCLFALALAVCWGSAPALCRAAPAPAAGPAKVKVDPLVPADSEQVASLDIHKVLASPMVKPQVPMLKMLLAGNKEVTHILEAIGLDPFKDLDSLTLSNKGQDGEGVLLVLRGRFQQDKIHAHLEKFAKAQPEKLSLTKEGGLQLYEIKGDQPAYAAFANNKTVVVTTSKERTVAAVKRAGKPGAKLNKGLAEAVDTLNGKEAMWMASVVTDAMKKAMASNPQVGALAPKLKAFTMGVTLQEASDLRLGILTTDEKAAAQVKKVIDQVMPLLQLIAQGNEEFGPKLTALLENLKVTKEKDQVVVNLKVTKELAEKLQKPGPGF